MLGRLPNLIILIGVNFNFLLPLNNMIEIAGKTRIDISKIQLGYMGTGCYHNNGDIGP
jgi:hypothetical protein